MFNLKYIHRVFLIHLRIFYDANNYQNKQELFITRIINNKIQKKILKGNFLYLILLLQFIFPLANLSYVI